jgi:hypothetical protein
MSDLHCFTDDVDTYVATSTGDAMALQREQHGMREGDQDPEAWEQIEDSEPLTIIPDPYDAIEVKVTKTCAEWIAERGRGFLCSTEW